MKVNKILFILSSLLIVSIAVGALPNKCGTIPALEAFRQGVKFTRPTLSKSISSTHFIIHFDTTGTNQVTRAYAESTKKYAERSWAKEVDTLKFAAPPPDGGTSGNNPNSLYDIYIDNLGSGILGTTTPEYYYTNPYPDGATSYIDIGNDVTSYGGWGELQVTVAHEFNHACQMRYSVTDGTWFMENTSTWMEDMVYDNINDYVNYLSSNPNPLDSPYQPINTSTNLYWYAGAIWAMFLQENYADSCPRKCWEKLGTSAGDNTLSGIDSTLRTKFSSNLQTALKKYAVWRYFTGTRADTFHFSEASTWPASAVLRTHSSYPASGTQSPSAPSGPGGTDFVEFTSGTNGLSTIFDGQDGSNWAAYLIGYRKPAQSDEQEFSLSTAYCDTMVMSWTGNSKIVLIPVVTQWASAANNRTFTYSATQVTSVNKDVGVTAIENPTGIIDSLSLIIPRARVRNYKPDSTTFIVILKIGSWTSSRSKKLNGSAEDTVNFSAWTPVRGTYATRCSVYLLNDTNKLNDTLGGSVLVNVTDVGVAKLIAPTGTFDSLTTVTPACSVYNYGTTTQTYLVRMIISSFYNDTFRVISQAGNGKNYITFTPHVNWPRGSQAVTCSTELAIDANPANNKKTGTIIITVTIPVVWTKMFSMPVGFASKNVKGGGALVAGVAGKIYGFKGNNRREFYAYDIGDDTWVVNESIPDDPTNRKRVNKGASLAYNKFTNPDYIYATKGNNTLELWRYDVTNNSWLPEPQVPCNPASVKKVKGGASLVFMKRGSQYYLYLLKGNNTREFYGYHCQQDTWMKTLDSAPFGTDYKRYRDGSCMAVGPDDKIYLLKGGAKYNEFYEYDASEDTWYILESIPRYNNITHKKTKVKDGAAICYNGDSLLYAFKGGNSQDFWEYNINQHKWTVQDTIPRGISRKKVSSGAALAFADSKVYALKGNNCLEFWCYDPEAAEKSKVKSQKLNCTEQTLQELKVSSVMSNDKIEVVPNPINNNSMIKFNLKSSGQVKISLYNSIGQMKSILLERNCDAGSYSVPIKAKGLTAGVYYIKCNIGNKISTIRVVIE